MPLLNCKINLILTQSTNCFISSGNRETKFAIVNIKLYIPNVTLSAQGNAKLLEQLTGINISQKFQKQKEPNI